MIFDKIKTALRYIAGALFGVLLIATGVLCKILKNKNKEISKLKTENKAKETELERTNTAKNAEVKHAHEMTEKMKDESATVNDIRNGKVSYSDIVGAWNDEK